MHFVRIDIYMDISHIDRDIQIGFELCHQTELLPLISLFDWLCGFTKILLAVQMRYTGKSSNVWHCICSGRVSPFIAGLSDEYISVTAAQGHILVYVIRVRRSQVCPTWILVTPGCCVEMDVGSTQILPSPPSRSNGACELVDFSSHCWSSSPFLASSRLHYVSVSTIFFNQKHVTWSTLAHGRMAY